MNILGIDYGHVRVGLAYADSEIGVAVPVAAAVEPNFEARLQHIGMEIKMRKIHKIVVGYPFNMDGSISQKAKEVDEFADELVRRFGLPVERCDERLSSFQAEQDMSAFKSRSKKSVASIKKKRKTGEVDSRAIALVLQDYLDGGMKPDTRGADFAAKD